MLDIARGDRLKVLTDGLDCPAADERDLGFEDIPKLLVEGVERALTGRPNPLPVPRDPFPVPPPVPFLPLRPH